MTVFTSSVFSYLQLCKSLDNVSRHVLFGFNFCISLPWSNKEKRSGPHTFLLPTLTFTSHLLTASDLKRTEKPNIRYNTLVWVGAALSYSCHEDDAWQFCSVFCIFLSNTSQCHRNVRELLPQGWMGRGIAGVTQIYIDN